MSKPIIEKYITAKSVSSDRATFLRGLKPGDLVSFRMNRDVLRRSNKEKSKVYRISSTKQYKSKNATLIVDSTRPTVLFDHEKLTSNVPKSHQGVDLEVEGAFGGFVEARIRECEWYNEWHVRRPKYVLARLLVGSEVMIVRPDHLVPVLDDDETSGVVYFSPPKPGRYGNPSRDGLLFIDNQLITTIPPDKDTIIGMVKPLVEDSMDLIEFIIGNCGFVNRNSGSSVPIRDRSKQYMRLVMTKLVVDHFGGDPSRVTHILGPGTSLIVPRDPLTDEILEIELSSDSGFPIFWDWPEELGEEEEAA